MGRRKLPRRLLRLFHFPSKLTSRISHGSSLRLGVRRSHKNPKSIINVTFGELFGRFGLHERPRSAPGAPSSPYRFPKLADSGGSRLRVHARVRPWELLRAPREPRSSKKSRETEERKSDEAVAVHRG